MICDCGCGAEYWGGIEIQTSTVSNRPGLIKHYRLECAERLKLVRVEKHSVIFTKKAMDMTE